MHPHAIEKYLQQLVEIKERCKVFHLFSSGAVNAIYEEATVEVTTLQLWRIIELLSFGFVLSLGEKALPFYASFVKYKNVENFFSQLDILDANFYPQPIKQNHGSQGEIQWDFPSNESYLNKEEFITLFQHCDRILEMRQVGASPMSLEQCKIANIRWHKKIVELLNAHLIELNDHEIAYLFQMSSADANPTCSHFKCKTGMINIDNKIKKQSDNVTLVDHLSRQLEFLRRSCELYDAGHLDESIRIALIIRVLIHDTDKSKSLLQEMDMKNNLRIVTSFGYEGRIPSNFKASSIIPIFANSGEWGTSVPFALSKPLNFMSVDEWWNEVVWMQESSLTRREIVLDTANKEGGAHVQPKAPKKIIELRQGLSQVTSVKVNGIEVGTPSNYHFILIRQFAHELLNSSSLTELIC